MNDLARLGGRIAKSKAPLLMLGGTALATALAVACTSNSSPSNSGGSDSGAASSSGGSSGSGSSSGTGTSSSSSGSGGSSGGSSGSGSGGGGGGGGGGDLNLTGAYSASAVSSLTVAGSNLYWIEALGSPSAAIMSVPTTGGAVTTVLADPTLDQDLATDGTLLYFTWTSADGGMNSELDSIKTDGTARTSLATGFQSVPHEGPMTGLFVAGGTVYFAEQGTPGDGPQIASAPVAGGTPTVVASSTQAQIAGPYWADSSGVYFSSNSPATGTGGIAWLPLTGSTTITLLNGVTGFGSMAVVNGVAYFAVPSSPTRLESLAIPPTGAAATTVGSFQDQDSICADAKGMYLLESGGGTPGIYSVNTTTWTQTLVSAGENGDIDTDVYALDSANLYYRNSDSLYAHAR